MRQRGGEAPGSAIGRDGAADRSAPGGGSAHIRAAAPRAAPAQRRQPPTEVGNGTGRDGMGRGGEAERVPHLRWGERGVGVGHAARSPLPAVSPGLAAHRGYLGVTRCPAVPARLPPSRFAPGRAAFHRPTSLRVLPLPRSARTARGRRQSEARPHPAGPGRSGRDGGAIPGSSPVRIFAITFGFGADFRAEFSSSHWLGPRNNYDHILILLAGAYCLLVVKDLLSIHQPPIFANYILLK